MNLDSALQLPSPVQPFPYENRNACQLFIKREDLIHPGFGGNKWRKLKYNLEEFQQSGYSRIVTFGGPFSNHIAAVASICKVREIHCTGVIRGEYSDPNNPTLNAARALGMELIHISKADYALKETSATFQQLIKNYDKPYVVPEGGSNALALRGVSELILELKIHRHKFDYIVVSAGTGMTASGIIAAAEDTQVVVMNALRNASLESTIRTYHSRAISNWEINDDYTFGGYAKVPTELVDFANDIYIKHKLRLDPIYNAKAFYGTLDLVDKDFFLPNSKVLYILTGGLQGITAYNYTNKKPSQALRY